MQIRRPKPRLARNIVGQLAPKTVPPLHITVRDEYITLGKLLKVAGVIGSGGEAKVYLAQTAVLVNGEPEQRRGRKLRPGDLIAPHGERPILLAAADDANAVTEANLTEADQTEADQTEGDEA